MSRNSYAGLTLAFFVVSLGLAGWCGWIDYAGVAAARGEAPVPGPFAARFASLVLANWQAVFLQVLWQAVGLAWVLRLGTAAARRRTERVERKLDALLHYLALDQEREDIDSTGGRWTA